MCTPCSFHVFSISSAILTLLKLFLIFFLVFNFTDVGHLWAAPQTNTLQTGIFLFQSSWAKKFLSWQCRWRWKRVSNDGANTNQRRSEEVQRGMKREECDKGAEGSREGRSNENWRELISIDHHRQLHYQHLLDTWWIHNHFLLCVGGCVYVHLRAHVSVPLKSTV